jgi:hypothetical protein
MRSAPEDTNWLPSNLYVHRFDLITRKNLTLLIIKKDYLIAIG